MLCTQGNIDIVDIMKKTRSFLFLYHTKHHAGIIMDNVTWYFLLFQVFSFFFKETFE